jgi:hypothetical protein
VEEPFGDNSHYWIVAIEKEPPIDMTPLRDAFSRFRFRMTFDRDFWGKLLPLATDRNGSGLDDCRSSTSDRLQPANTCQSP